MVINKLLTDSLVHASEWVVLASKISFQLGQSIGHHLLNVDSLLLGDSGGETESINITSNTDTGGVDGDSGFNVTLDLLWVHVGGVLGIGGDAVVVLDDGIEDLGEILVGVPVTSVDSTMLVIEFDSTGNSLTKSKSRGGSLDRAELVPDRLGHILGDQGLC